MSSSHYDVVVVGGGIVGASLAVAAARSGFATALIEARQPDRVQPDDSFALRQSAVATGPRRLLENTGIWQRIPASRACRFSGMKIWEDNRDDMLFVEHTALGLPELGHIVENAAMVEAAWDGLDHADVYCPAKLASLAIDDQAAHITLDDDQTLTAALIVGAEGAGSPTRESVGIRTTGWDYGQRCTVGTITPTRHHQHIAWQRFTESGPVAFLPLSDGRCSLAWHADVDLANELAGLDDEAFVERLSEASEEILGPIREVATRASFPLKLMHAGEYVRPRVALVGDAAHTVHPMVGQGINLGLLDVASLMNALEAGRQAGADPGALMYLKRYQRDRMADNMMMLGAADLCKRVYGSAHPLIRGLRSLALPTASRLAPVRQLMIRQATGLSVGGVPLLRQSR